MSIALTLALGAVITAFLLMRLRGFRAQRPADYTQTAPEFDLRTHLSGPLLCEGVIYGPWGRVRSRFTARLEGRWSGPDGVLSETFTYSSGAVQCREWRLTVGSDNRFIATAEDVLGTANGTQSGASLCMTYRLRLPDDAGGHVLWVTDWMYLLENGTIINRSQMRKFGVKVAELVATLRPVPA